MVNENYKCEECNNILENVIADSGDLLPKRLDCPKCKAKSSCYRIWQSGIVIQDHMRALPRSGATWARERMKNAKGPSGKKHFY